MHKKQKARVTPQTPGPIRVGSNTHRLLELVAKAVAESLAAGGKDASDGGRRPPKRARKEGSADGL